MNPHMKTLLALLILCNGATFAQDINPGMFKSKVASRAVRQYLSRGEKATEKFLEEKEDATEELIEVLEKALKQATSDGDLDEALKIRKSIEELKKNVHANPSTLATNLVGRWKIRYTKSGIYYNDIIKSGDDFKVKRWIEPDKKLETDPELLTKDGQIWIVWNAGERRDRIHLLPDGRIFVEHFFVRPGTTMSEYPQDLAVGEKMKQ